MRICSANNFQKLSHIMGKDDEDAKDGQGEVTEMHADVKSTDIIQLQLALTKSLQRQGQLQDELISLKASSEQVSTHLVPWCHFGSLRISKALTDKEVTDPRTMLLP